MCFYKYLQPVSDSRKLHLNIPVTVICEKKEGREETLWLRTDTSGVIIKDDKPQPWRKRLYMELSQQDGLVSPDEVIAVRNVAHWKGGSNNKSVVLTRRIFDYILNGPSELAFTVQRYIRCRGTQSSVYRIVWAEKESQCFAINIINDHKFSEVREDPAEEEALRTNKPLKDVPMFELAMRKASRMAKYFCVSSTNDPKHLRLPKIRGPPITEGVQAVKRITDHVQAQLPGIRFKSMTADFIKDAHGTWWFIRVMSFSSYYRVQIPRGIAEVEESVIQLPEILRSKYFRQALSALHNTTTENPAIPHCSLCNASCDFSARFKAELAEVMAKADTSDELLKALPDYRMTLHMAVETIYAMRQRGLSLTTWETAMAALRKSPVQACGFVVCSLCYRVYKQQLALSKVAIDMHKILNTTSSGVDDFQDDANPTASTVFGSAIIESTLRRIHQFEAEDCPTMSSSAGEKHSLSQYFPARGSDVDPTSMQMRLVFFFHELQDGGPDIAPTEFFLEYQLGQVISRLEFEGSKCHTPNRWQLCESRIHYVFAPIDNFIEYCMEKKMQIKMKTVEGEEFHGYTVVPFRPLMSASNRFGNSLLPECRTDYLIEVRTDLYGLLTLKLTLGLLVDPVPLSQVRELVRDADFLREDPAGIFWPPQSFCIKGMALPSEWIGALMPSEYISVIPMKSRAMLQRDKTGLGLLDRNSRRGSLQSVSSSRRFSLATTSEGRVSDSSSNPRAEKAESPKARSSAGKNLVGPLLVVKRVIFRVAGDVDDFPTLLLAHLLRYSNFLSLEDGFSPSWAQPAVMRLTRKYSCDRLFVDIRSLSVPALVVLGELLFVLLSNNLIDQSVQMNDLEDSISPYWLQDKADEWITVPRNYECLPIERTVWNRAIRRCQVARLCPAIRPNPSLYPKQNNNDDDGSDQGRDNAHRKNSFRVKMHSFLICDIFEALETMDIGYVDIAELRSLCKVLPSMDQLRVFRMPDNLNPIKIRESLHRDELHSLLTILETTHALSFEKAIHTLLESEVMRDALLQFDKIGCGENFTSCRFLEFLQLAESAVDAQRIFFNSDEEPTEHGFCLRHGKAELYLIDNICVQCSMEFRDQEQITDHNTPGILRAEQVNTGRGKNKASDVTSQNIKEDEEQREVADAVQGEKTGIGVRGPLSDFDVQSEDGEILEDGVLRSILEKLEAAEWHIVHREGTVGRASLQATINERKSSIGKSNRNSPRRSIRNSINPEFMFAAAENMNHLDRGQAMETERRCSSEKIRRKSPSKNRRAYVTVTKRKKKKRQLTKQRAAQILSSSKSVSSILREELFDRRGGPSMNKRMARSTGELLETITHVEEKRKELDRMVLGEIDEVKRRLSVMLANQ
ncbi:TPA: hypothetical protein N0F65_007793 [Lagenidium giganteum]|uniref:Uncharacterized protein n=1 Tax=Lagenidium giganteum TaxID=4803 RepID=A0AAV2Z477_9STRA|nr:TPA: hypothetical protein N0F65_007793 [Lagenidium giganteum]